jgi:hypothetical protein
MNLEETLDCLSVYDGNYKRECVDAAVQHLEEITPRLLSLLDDVLAQPEAHAEKEIKRKLPRRLPYSAFRLYR